MVSEVLGGSLVACHIVMNTNLVMKKAYNTNRKKFMNQIVTVHARSNIFVKTASEPFRH